MSLKGDKWRSSSASTLVTLPGVVAEHCDQGMFTVISTVGLKTCFAAVRGWICKGWMPQAGNESVPSGGGHMCAANLPVPMETFSSQPWGDATIAGDTLTDATDSVQSEKGSHFQGGDGAPRGVAVRCWHHAGTGSNGEGERQEL